MKGGTVPVITNTAQGFDRLRPILTPTTTRWAFAGLLVKASAVLGRNTYVGHLQKTPQSEYQQAKVCEKAKLKAFTFRKQWVGLRTYTFSVSCAVCASLH